MTAAAHARFEVTASFDAVFELVEVLDAGGNGMAARAAVRIKWRFGPRAAGPSRRARCLGIAAARAAGTARNAASVLRRH